METLEHAVVHYLARDYLRRQRELYEEFIASVPAGYRRRLSQVLSEATEVAIVQLCGVDYLERGDQVVAEATRRRRDDCLGLLAYMFGASCFLTLCFLLIYLFFLLVEAAAASSSSGSSTRNGNYGRGF